MTLACCCALAGTRACLRCPQYLNHVIPQWEPMADYPRIPDQIDYDKLAEKIARELRRKR